MPPAVPCARPCYHGAILTAPRDRLPIAASGTTRHLREAQNGGLHEREVTGWVGWVVFAAVILVMVGVFSIIGGLIAIFDDSWGAGALGSTNSAANTWGWTTLILGVIILFAAFGILQGRTWARIVAVIVASLSRRSTTSHRTGLPDLELHRHPAEHLRDLTR